jgi:hypothetical protein
MAALLANLVVAKEVNISIYQRDTTGLRGTTTIRATGVAKDLSTAVLVMEVRKATDNTLVDTFSTTSTDITISGTGNNIFTIKGFSRLPYLAEGYVYDLENTQGGNVVTYMYGTISVKKDITVA